MKLGDAEDFTPLEEYNVFSGEMNHALDRRNESRDPADIDLQPFRDAAHADRLKQEKKRRINAWN